MASINSTELLTILSSGQPSINDVSSSAAIINTNKESFFNRITRGSVLRAGARTGRYNGSLILKTEDLLNLLNLSTTTPLDCIAVHCSFSYKRGRGIESSPRDFTNLVFQKIIADTAGNLTLDPAIFSTEKIIIPTPDPVFHCPGPACNP